MSDFHKFHSIYGTLHPQGWQIHYAHATLEAPYNHMQALTLLYADWKRYKASDAGVANLSPHSVAGSCHLANLVARF